MHGRTPNSASPRPQSVAASASYGRLILLAVVAVGVITAAILFTGGDQGGTTLDAASGLTLTSTPDSVATPDPLAAAGAVADADSAVADPAVADPAVADPAVNEPAVDIDGCMLAVVELKLGDSGESVQCTQKALYASGFYEGDVTGEFDSATDAAVRAVQVARGLYADGIVGANTATSLGIWPGDDSFVVRTPKPAPGAVDLLGYELSSVASAGDDAPPVPADTGEGTGKRIVYSRAEQRVWAIDDEERIVRSYLVTGSQYHNEVPGKHEIYSKSETTTAWNGAADLPLMVRWLDTERGAIGFHGIPKHRDTGEPYQTEDELGQKLSGGCQRQALADARFMWDFGTIGTPVYVV